MINLDEIYVGDIINWTVGEPISWFVLSVKELSYHSHLKNCRNVIIISEIGRIENTFVSELSGCTIWHTEELSGRESNE